MSRTTLTLLIGAALLVGCSKAAPEQDTGKTPAQVAEQAKQADQADLEKAVAAYQEAIKNSQDEVDALQKQIKEAASSAIGDVLGQPEEGGQAGKVDVEGLKQQVADLTDRLQDLKAKLDVYAQELASRVEQAAGGQPAG